MMLMGRFDTASGLEIRVVRLGCDTSMRARRSLRGSDELKTGRSQVSDDPTTHAQETRGTDLETPPSASFSHPRAFHLPEGYTSPFLNLKLPLPVLVCPSGLPTFGGKLEFDVTRDLAGDGVGRGAFSRTVEPDAGVGGEDCVGPWATDAGASKNSDGETWKLVDLGMGAARGGTGDCVRAEFDTEGEATDLDRLPPETLKASNGDTKLNIEGLGFDFSGVCSICSEEVSATVRCWGGAWVWGSMRSAIDSDGGGEGEVKPVLTCSEVRGSSGGMS